MFNRMFSLPSFLFLLSCSSMRVLVLELRHWVLQFGYTDFVTLCSALIVPSKGLITLYFVVQSGQEGFLI